MILCIKIFKLQTILDDFGSLSGFTTFTAFMSSILTIILGVVVQLARLYAKGKKTVQTIEQIVIGDLDRQRDERTNRQDREIERQRQNRTARRRSRTLTLEDDGLFYGSPESLV